MRAVVLVALLALSCGQANPAAGARNPSPTPVVPASPSSTQAATPSQTTTAVTETIEQLLDRCPSPAELASVDSSVSMMFTSDPSAGRLVCTAAQGSRDLTLLQERAYQAVLMFTWIRFDAPVPWTKLPLDAWFAHAIHGVDFRGDIQYSYCCNPDGVIVISSNLAVLSPNLNRFQTWLANSGLAALFVHEARHNEGYVHTCGTKDDTIAELGAWGVQYYFVLWLGTHSDPAVIPEPLRSWARLEAESYAGNTDMFCNPSASPTT